MIQSYPSIYNLGHAAIADLLKGPVLIEEKVDGSQISFGKSLDGVVSMRSKGADINMVAPEGMFTKAVATVQALADWLTPGYTYRGEYLRSPHHNALTYNRTPKDHIILFDVCTGLETYLSYADKNAEAERLKLECVPLLFSGVITDPTMLRTFLERESVLGGPKIEGVVIKPANYDLFGRDKKVLIGKFVSEAFKEVHSKTWEKEHKTPGSNDVIEVLAAQYNSTARWQKALIHLKERDLIVNAPQDIGLLMKEVPEDVLKECEAEIKQALFDWAWPQLRRRVGRGLPEWYKEQLAKTAFDGPPANEPEPRPCLSEADRQINYGV